MSNDVELAKPQTFAMETIAKAANAYEVWENAELFTQLQRGATLLAKSQLVPKAFQGEEHISDCFLGLAIARATQQDPVMVLQNLYVANGRAGWYSKYMIARANASGVFEGVIRFRAEDLGEIEAIQKTKTGWDSQERKPIYKESKHKVRNISVTAYANLRNVKGESLVEQTVTMQMASDDGWTQNEKYFTIPQRMLEWRAASWLINLYAPHILFGLPTAEELQDVNYEVVQDDPMDRIAAGSAKPQVVDYAPQGGGGAAAGTTAAGSSRRAPRGTRGAAQAASSPPPAVDVQPDEPQEPAGTIGGAQIEGDDDGGFDAPKTEDSAPPEHVATIITPTGGEQMFKIPTGAKLLGDEWEKWVASFVGNGYAGIEKFWNSNAAEVVRLGSVDRGLAEHLQNLASGVAKAEKKADKAKAAAAAEASRAAAEDQQRQGEHEPGPGDQDSGGGTPDPMEFLTGDGEITIFDKDADAEKWLHEQITGFLSVDDLNDFYETNQTLMDVLGFGPVVETQRKALTKAPAPTPTTVTPAAAVKFHAAVRPLDVPGNDLKQAFAALTKVLDELRDNGGKAADYAELAKINEAIIGQIRTGLQQWFKTLEKRFAKEGVKV